jgi:hypothetical protein
LTACSGSGGSSGAASDGESAGPASDDQSALIATVEEQGSFNTPCELSHTAPDDPIVHPGHEGLSHRHDFFGATTTDASSDAESLLTGGTNCRSAADHTAYWTPSVLDSDRPVEPVELLAYYRVPVGADATQVEAPPNGLEMIAGDASATEPQDPAIVGWACGLSEQMAAQPQRCEDGTELRLQLHFDPCWDGENLSSSDHRSHLASLTEGGACPQSHPVLLPELTVEVRYPTGGTGGITPGQGSEGLTLASGPALGGHGDALMAWDEDHISREVEVCLRRNLRCDVVSESTRLDVDESA